MLREFLVSSIFFLLSTLTIPRPLLEVSLKCGGVGLTLTRANRVISLGEFYIPEYLRFVELS